MRREVSFTDMNGNRFHVTIGIEGDHHMRRSAETLESRKVRFRVAVSVRCLGCDGGNPPETVPRTEAQRLLLDFCDRYHLNNFLPGTDIQMGYLKSGRYKEDCGKLLEGFRFVWRHNINRDPRLVFVMVFAAGFGLTAENLPSVDRIVRRHLPKQNPVGHFFNARTGELNVSETDNRLRCVLLELNGLYTDRGYKYGSDWLARHAPEDICETAESLCKTVESEEAEYRAALEAG